MAKISLGEFEKRYGVSKTRVWKTAKDAGIDTSSGLDSNAVTELKGLLNVWEPSGVEEAAIVPLVETLEIAPSKANGQSFEIVQVGDVHIHIHSGNADHYSAQAENTHEQTQELIKALMTSARKQGAMDAQEDNAIYKSVREGRLNQKIAGMLDSERDAA